MTEETTTAANEEQRESGKQMPRVQVSPHPLGGVSVLARDPEGNQLVTRIELSEATFLIGHLQAIVTMTFQQAYMEAAMAAADAQNSKIVIPGAK